MKGLAQKAIDCCRQLATFTEEQGRITRTFLSPPMKDVHRVLGDWMRSAGMNVRIDAAGNLRGLFGDADARRMVVASHLDTVPNAGAFDGPLGVVLGIALVEALVEHRGIAIEVIGFSEEEGVRYGIPFIGSRAVTGTLDEATIERISPAICEFGLNPVDLSEAQLSSEAFGYLELHIEQGPELEGLGLPVGVVDAIAGQSRLTLEFEGHANHAGTTPMLLRRDALVCAAEWICMVEAFGKNREGLVATVGSIKAEPNAPNVIAGHVRLSLDVRHADDMARKMAVNLLLRAASDLCVRRGIRLCHTEQLDQAAVEMSPDLRQTLASAVEAAGYPVHHMISGAGHDAMIFAPHVPSVMLFLRSPGGISHHPDEAVLIEDVEAALHCGVEFVRQLEHEACLIS